MAPFRKALIVNSWRCGSTVLNLSLIQHPSIFGLPIEMPFVPSDVPPEGWAGEPWVLFKNPQDAPIIASILSAKHPPERVILLMRNPYAICLSYMKKGYLSSYACQHMRALFVPLLAQEAKTPNLFYRARFESLATEPRPALTDLLDKVFNLPFDERCLHWPEDTVVPWGMGDPDVRGTTGWEPKRVQAAWRVELPREIKAYVREHCADLFEAFAYEPED